MLKSFDTGQLEVEAGCIRVLAVHSLVVLRDGCQAVACGGVLGIIDLIA